MKSKTLARVYSFDIKFRGGRRTSFYRKLLGFTSRMTRTDRDGRIKTYTRDYPGILTSIPHIHLGKSVIAVPVLAARRLDSFFENPRWGPIELHAFDAILPAQDRLEAMWEAFGRVGVQPDLKLAEEVTSLHSLLARAPPDSEIKHRIRRTLRAAEELAEVDWSDGRRFSQELEVRLAPLRRQL